MNINKGRETLRLLRRLRASPSKNEFPTPHYAGYARKQPGMSPTLVAYYEMERRKAARRQA